MTCSDPRELAYSACLQIRDLLRGRASYGRFLGYLEPKERISSLVGERLQNVTNRAILLRELSSVSLDLSVEDFDSTPREVLLALIESLIRLAVIASSEDRVDIATDDIEEHHFDLGHSFGLEDINEPTLSVARPHSEDANRADTLFFQIFNGLISDLLKSVRGLDLLIRSELGKFDYSGVPISSFHGDRRLAPADLQAVQRRTEAYFDRAFESLTSDLPVYEPAREAYGGARTLILGSGGELVGEDKVLADCTSPEERIELALLQLALVSEHEFEIDPDLDLEDLLSGDRVNLAVLAQHLEENGVTLEDLGSYRSILAPTWLSLSVNNLDVE